MWHSFESNFRRRQTLLSLLPTEKLYRKQSASTNEQKKKQSAPNLFSSNDKEKLYNNENNTYYLCVCVCLCRRQPAFEATVLRNRRNHIIMYTRLCVKMEESTYIIHTRTKDTYYIHPFTSALSFCFSSL